ncbi:hypothetical protein VDG1235_2238 [Verrucomicrobiia bacterium DG1235]|nr:hypothetical protein VDG1235_2238 [Verrucomicrobiae bacterium DG1235]
MRFSTSDHDRARTSKGSIPEEIYIEAEALLLIPIKESTAPCQLALKLTSLILQSGFGATTKSPTNTPKSKIRLAPANLI